MTNVHEISTLDHKALDDTVKLATLVSCGHSSLSVLAGAQLSEGVCIVRRSEKKKKRRRRRKGDATNRKFSAVLGTMSAKSSILMRPTACPAIEMSKKTMGLSGFAGSTIFFPSLSLSVAVVAVDPSSVGLVVIWFSFSFSFVFCLSADHQEWRTRRRQKSRTKEIKI